MKKISMSEILLFFVFLLLFSSNQTLKVKTDQFNLKENKRFFFKDFFHLKTIFASFIKYLSV
ncbi:hypothetical protein BpHYR1_040839 [Brachionus plicatilis]|uniref:Uncharacterized protein n=1 Tax=Brachionus plicatilis TaxID=10195 RepID=A0A3M7PH75_BRAPC|nr:hypothetical protein BpHYR1_040839 [Brachionus plicatilis]